jgi:MoaA/NifB/PqqE/SkfB family radical SAM enzyme
MDDVKQVFDFLKTRHHVCNAPFVSLNFKSTGVVSACCMSRDYELGRYPESTLIDIWFGERVKAMREAIDKFDFSKGCTSCLKQITAGNYHNSLLAAFQHKTPPASNVFPTIFEFEISSICNYECIMCGGDWSSSIRKNREKLPPLRSPYDDEFLKQLTPFIPHLQCARFLGGEPFATPLYYKIWDTLYKYNPNIEIIITTNGSILNQNVINMFDKYKDVAICISIDSLNPDTYKFIRRNGNLDTVLKNIEKIRAYEREKNRKIFNSIAVCPMIQNWQDIPDLLYFCDRENVNICFNTVTGILGTRIKGIHENGKEKQGITVSYDDLLPEVSIDTLPKETIAEIIHTYKQVNVKNIHNQHKFQNLISSLQCMIQ